MENVDFYLDIMNKYIDKTQKYMPLYAMFEITDLCNFRCRHCYIPNHIKDKGTIIEKDIAISILRQLKRLGCIKLLITGGEAILHPNFFDIYNTAYELGFVLTLFSNGYSFDNRIISYLSKRPPDKIGITLYGWDNESYYKFTNKKDAFKKVYENLCALLKSDLEFDLKASLTTSNISYIDNLNALASSFNKKIKYDGIIINSLDHSNSTLFNRLTPQEVINFEDDYKIIPTIHNYSLTNNSNDEELLFKCGAGKNSFCINASGELLACSQLRISPYDLKKGNLEDGIKHFTNLVNQNMPENMKCKNCKYIDFCRYCPGRFLLEANSMFTPPDWYCLYGKLSYEKHEKM